jgi:hypothetical protein
MGRNSTFLLLIEMNYSGNLAAPERQRVARLINLSSSQQGGQDLNPREKPADRVLRRKSSAENWWVKDAVATLRRQAVHGAGAQFAVESCR